MLCLGPKMSLSALRLELTAQVRYRSAIQAPLEKLILVAGYLKPVNVLMLLLMNFRLKNAEKNRQTRRRPGSRAAAAARNVISGSSGGLTVPGSFGSPGSSGLSGGGDTTLKSKPC